MNLNVEFAGLSWFNMNCLEFVNILLPVPKVNKLSVPIFFEEKRDFTTYGGENFFFQLKRNVILWVEVSME